MRCSMLPRPRNVARAVGSRGFTLIELMVAMVISAIVVLGIFAFSSIQQQTNNFHSRNIRVQQALEGAMWSVAQDVRAAGTGWTRMCTELRVYDAVSGQLINPGGSASPGTATLDSVTGEPYWVLRDGLQAHWNSSGVNAFTGAGDPSSASPTSAADALDVIVPEAAYLGTPGVFTLPEVYDPADDRLTVATGIALDNTNPAHLAEVQQLFPPGTFVLLVNFSGTEPFRPENQSQCVLMQVTADVEADGSDPQEWRIPVGNGSPFNADRAALFNDASGYSGVGDDFDPADFNAGGTSVVPLGRLRWSRYEIDYTIATIPYLVRYDLIGFQDGDLTGLGAVDYPHCLSGNCQAPGLHLPTADGGPSAVAIGPMIEDIQVAVGCDGYTAAGIAAAGVANVPDPDLTYEEVGPIDGAFPGVPNVAVDENSPDSGFRTRDEWLGNAVDEVWAPDCVSYGTGQFDAAAWIGVEGTGSPPPAFRMSPQAVRVTLVASSEFPEEAGGLSVLEVLAVEDRIAIDSPVGIRQRFTLTEQFTPGNLRWRDPRVE